MAGGEIICGSFNGKPESGSAYPGVLASLEERAEGKAREILRALRKPLVKGDLPDHVEISPNEAAVLEPLLSAYKKELVKIIGHSNWSKAADQEEAQGLDPTEAQSGKGKGWQLYCVTDLIRACRTCVAENETIYIAFL